MAFQQRYSQGQVMEKLAEEAEAGREHTSAEARRTREAQLPAARQALEVLADEQAAFKGPPSISDRDLKIIHAFANLKADLLP